MASQDVHLNHQQSNAITNIIHHEFAPWVRNVDSDFTLGYSSVEEWVFERQQIIFATHPYFQGDAVVQNRQRLRRLIERKFRQYYNTMRRAYLASAPEGQDAAPQ
ncbi:unnamed protein product [Peniophora sp. CBMAI 1063]|nr:unnamed protein product [Peniophora sp. CBMAI 1063]